MIHKQGRDGLATIPKQGRDGLATILNKAETLAKSSTLMTTWRALYAIDNFVDRET